MIMSAAKALALTRIAVGLYFIAYAWDKTSKNRPQQERFTTTKKGTVLDGFVIDQREQCPYSDDKQTGRREDPSCDGPIRFARHGVQRLSDAPERLGIVHLRRDQKRLAVHDDAPGKRLRREVAVPGLQKPRAAARAGQREDPGARFAR